MKKIIKVACAQVSSEKTDQESLEKLIRTVEEHSESDLIVFDEPEVRGSAFRHGGKDISGMNYGEKRVQELIDSIAVGVFKR